jgi:hypothetical protein
MSSSRKPRAEQAPSTYPTQSLWHASKQYSLSLGCQGCFYRADCGGLEVQADVFDCTDFCRCENGAACDTVCPNNPVTLVARLQEVRGLKLDNVPPALHLAYQPLPASIPLISHGSGREAPLVVNAVALPLAQLVDFASGRVKFATREALHDAFHLGCDVKIVLTGTDRDKHLERWWALADRESVIQDLKNLGITLITTPNFSLFNDVPRLDNLYNIKRIALTWSEVQASGLPCAPHLNARTDHDWYRWTQFLAAHGEIDTVSVEFGTGAGYETRIAWHVEQLTQLAEKLARPMRLIVRGGVPVLPLLWKAYSSVTLIDSRPFFKTVRRQRAMLIDGVLRWQRAPTDPGAPLDELLQHNAVIVEGDLARSLGRTNIRLTAASFGRYETSGAANDARDETL